MQKSGCSTRGRRSRYAASRGGAHDGAEGRRGVMPKLSLFSNNFPDFFIVERSGDVDISKIETDDDRRNATFEWTGPALDFGETGRLVRAALPLGFCLRIDALEGFRVVGKFFTGIIDPDVAE